MVKGAKTRARAAMMADEPSPFLAVRLRDNERETESKAVVQLTKFFGETGKDIEVWLKSFDRISKANGWTDKRQCDILPAFLRERAAEFYDELPPRTQNNLDVLKAALVEHFIPKEARRFYYPDLYSRKQGELETAEDFGREIQKLVRRAYAEMPVEHQDTLMREHFVNGLRPDLKRIVLICDPQEFSKAVEYAKREEINDQVTNGAVPWIRKRASVPVAATAGGDNASDHLYRLERMVQKLTVTIAERNHAPSENTSNYGRRYNYRDDRNLRITDGRQICTFCKKVGHIEIKCFAKNKDNGEKPKN